MTALGQAPKSTIRKNLATGRWVATVWREDGGGYAVSEFDSFDAALAGRHLMFAALTQNLPPVRGDAWIGPRGRESVA